MIKDNGKEVEWQLFLAESWNDMFNDGVVVTLLHDNGAKIITNGKAGIPYANHRNDGYAIIHSGDKEIRLGDICRVIGTDNNINM